MSRHNAPQRREEAHEARRAQRKGEQVGRRVPQPGHLEYGEHPHDMRQAVDDAHAQRQDGISRIVDLAMGVAVRVIVMSMTGVLRFLGSPSSFPRRAETAVQTHGDHDDADHRLRKLRDAAS